ncbi:MAG: 4Fe-4S dicluster domain-containing protein [Deltaproteobacteria bacterium]|jgi:electron transport complex protein RnfB|nr:4Fe-4S dicluster domain-containing protein [Deltaproteobacteria bacterium]
MREPVLQLISGPFANRFQVRNDLLASAFLLPYLLALIFQGFYFAPLSLLSCLAVLALFRRRANNFPASFSLGVLSSLTALIALGPSTRFLPFLAAGLVSAAAALSPQRFRRPILAASLSALVLNFVLYRSFIGLAADEGFVLPASLIPFAIFVSFSGARKWRSLLVLWLVWLASAWLAILTGFFFAWQDLHAAVLWWIFLSFGFGQEFRPDKKFNLAEGLTLAAGLAILPGQPFALLALILLTVFDFRPSRLETASRPAVSPACPLAALRTDEAEDSKIIENEEKPDLVVVRLCLRQPDDVKFLAKYRGPASCRFAAILDDGPLECREGCLGLGDCLSFCPHQAIRPAEEPNAPPKLDPARCRGCGQCLSACPKGLLVLRPRSAAFVVRCRGSARMRDMDKLCPQGCLGCGLCRKACPAGALDKMGPKAPPPVKEEICAQARPDCGLACRTACPRSLPGPAMGWL